jgi:hypothetical protein
VTGTSAWGWTIDAQIQTAPPDSNGETNRTAPPLRARIILKYPPRQEQAEFEKLVTRRQELTAERERLQQVALSSVQTASNAAKQYDPNRPWKLASRTAVDDATAARSAASDAREQLRAVDGQLAIIARKLAAYPDPNRYVVDCFALDTRARQNGLPVYEYGMVMK